ncbi:MAG: hypothetical protein FWD68_15625 [Alphaproteobacteria bacterium]|nr:hypothetical protein [Alphaproteobacteria bacterium]
MDDHPGWMKAIFTGFRAAWPSPDLGSYESLNLKKGSWTQDFVVSRGQDAFDLRGWPAVTERARRDENASRHTDFLQPVLVGLHRMPFADLQTAPEGIQYHTRQHPAKD